LSGPKLQRNLSLFDVVNLVIGAIIGADIYVASSFGAGLLGPFSVIVWIIAGVIAIIIALNFAQCAALVPKVGGPYAYAREAFGPLPGFMVGWSLWLAEWISLAVFPVAFVRYLLFFIPTLDLLSQALIKVVFVAFLITTNIIGVKAAGRTNDILTIVKITPLALFVIVGFIFMFISPSVFIGNYSPFVPFGFSNLGLALVLIFWAYAGFEVSTIPADVVDRPDKTIPKAIIIGITIVTIFYLTTNLILFGAMSSIQLAVSPAPIPQATNIILIGIPIIALVISSIIGIGALLSVAGSDESGMIGTSRLTYALAVDGHFPHIFARTHPKYQTPYLAIIIPATAALIVSIIGTLEILVSSSVFFLSFAYLGTSISLFKLRKTNNKTKNKLPGGIIIPILSTVFSAYLITQVGLIQLIVGIGALIFGIIMFVIISPKIEIQELKLKLLSSEIRLKRIYDRERRFLANLLRLLKRLYRRLARKKQTWEK
jgi:APA family basic amino acid/polyamine antiporter